ncbi:MAG TPA: phospholipase D-like domain-containing protein, partial [Acinetobacter sp.]|nr:phospholipase D-like domain-containing protein [Acinetobacter sp.]
VQNYLDLANRSQAFEQWLDHSIQFDWVKAKVVKDSPNKTRDKAAPEDYLNHQLISYLETPNSSLDIVSAYFVPEKKGTDILGKISQKGVQVRVLTNSFIANDVALVHAFYGKYRQDLLENGVQMYEFLAAPEQENWYRNTEELSQKAKISLRGLSHSSLHAKMLAIDESQVFIGSFNFDPRSAYLNTEIGVILNSPPLAKAVHETMDQNLSKYAYKLVLDANNQINWQLTHPNGNIKTYTKEPKMKWWHKAGVKFISWLPVEGFM